METLEVTGGNSLRGEVQVSGAKNVAAKAILAGLLTNDELIIHNVPHILDFETMVDLMHHLGVKTKRTGHTVRIQGCEVANTQIPLAIGARARTSILALGPLLARYGRAQIPNPGGCRLGARPIDRHIEGLQHMGAVISYHSDDGYFYAKVNGKLQGTTYTFAKNTHTGTEIMLLAAVLADGETVLNNAAQEPEVDNMIELLVGMGARIKRIKPRIIVIQGVEKLHGCEFTVMPDRNEAVTFAIAAMVTHGDIVVHGAQKRFLVPFLDHLKHAHGTWEEKDAQTIRFFVSQSLKAVDVVTNPHPGFMTDWQAPWSVLMSQAEGCATIHETVFEDRFSYVSELRKLGAKIEFFNPDVSNKEEFYNFNLADDRHDYFHAIRIFGPTRLHNGILRISDLRAGATLVLSALAATGTSFIYGVETMDRGYEKIEKRLSSLGASIRRIKE